MTDERPSSSAQALVAVERDASPRALKSSFDELDDDDYAVIGRVFAGVTPRRLLSGLGAVLGAGAGAALATVSVFAGSAVLVGIVGLAFVVGRRDMRAQLVEHGLAPDLIETIFRTSLRQMRRANRRADRHVNPWRVIPRTEDFVRSGRIHIDAARAERER